MQYKDKMALLEQMIGFGYSAMVAQELVELKAANIEEINGLRKKIDICRTIDLDDIPQFEGLTEDQRNVLLWNLGINTKHYRYCVDVICHNLSAGKTKCGKVVFGAERLDKEWLTKEVGGVKVASLEARFHKDRDELEVMRGNKSVNKA